MESSSAVYLLALSLLVFFTPQARSVAYDVHWLSGAQTIDRDISSIKQNIDIYCYRGTPKNILALWQTAKFHIRIKNDEFSEYIGRTPEEVYKEYAEDSYGWAVVGPLLRRARRSLAIDLFNTTCMAVNTKHRHSIELQIIRVDLWRALLMVCGAGAVLLARPLSGNPLFFYLCGVLLGVSASFMVLVYYLSRLLPRKTLTYGVLIGGWTVGVYIFQQLWENIRSIVLSYQTYLFWYTLVAGFCSFVVCYRAGPPRDPRSRNLVMWTLQGAGVLMMFFSSEYQEASTGAAVAALGLRYFPRPVLAALHGYWRRKFPPSPRLLTSEEYYEQGARETRRALEQLREHCASPDCAQWRIMLKLDDSKRFASFVEGDSHLSDAEILDYETYAFSPERRKREPRSPLSPARSPPSPARSPLSPARSPPSPARSPPSPARSPLSPARSPPSPARSPPSPARSATVQSPRASSTRLTPHEISDDESLTDDDM